MSWFRPGLSPYQTALAMIGAKSGHQVVVLGAPDPGLIAQVALVTGLPGRTLVVDPDPAVGTSMEKAATEAGALVDTATAPLSQLPVNDGSTDVVVVNSELGARAESERHVVIAEAVRILRPGGRIVAIDVDRRSGLRGAFARSGPPAVKAEVLRDVLVSIGLRAARVFNEGRTGTFIEAVKPGHGNSPTPDA